MRYRSFMQALLQCDQDIEKLLTRLEIDVDSTISFAEDEFDLWREDSVNVSLGKLRKLKRRREELRRTIKKISKREKLIKAKQTKSNLKSALSLQLNDGMRTG